MRGLPPMLPLGFPVLPLCEFHKHSIACSLPCSSQWEKEEGEPGENGVTYSSIGGRKHLWSCTLLHIKTKYLHCVKYLQEVHTNNIDPKEKSESNVEQGPLEKVSSGLNFGSSCFISLDLLLYPERNMRSKAVKADKLGMAQLCSHSPRLEGSN